MFSGWLSLEKAETQERKLTNDRDIDVKCSTVFCKGLGHSLQWAMRRCVRHVVQIKACGPVEVIHIWTGPTLLWQIPW